MTTDVRPRPIAVPHLWARDGVFVWLSLAHAAVLLLAPSAVLIGIGLWWNANTIAHNFIHRPFFKSRAANSAYSAFLSLVLGLPQRLWRARHLAHHAELSTEAVASSRPHRVGRFRWTPAMLGEGALVLALWAAVAAISPKFFVGVYLPGWILGLGLCLLQGHFEHARGTTSHYGRIYNALFFNDGYHVEHHARPGASWAALPDHMAGDATQSRWPAVLRWLDWFSLESLERLVLRWPALQRLVMRVHERAFRAVLPALPADARVVIVGGGLFPRTALVLRRVLPDASLVIVDADAANLEVARTWLGATADYRHEFWDPRRPETADVIVIPLAFRGDRRRVYERPAAPIVLVHDWIWRHHAPGVRISWLLLKRLNLVRR
jgi:hypothetical protein